MTTHAKLIGDSNFNHAYTVMVKKADYDRRWRWTHSGISFPILEWWKRQLWPTIEGARGAVHYWTSVPGWTAKIVRVLRRKKVKK